MHKQLFFFLIILALSGFSCKKNESPVAPPAPKATIVITNLQNGAAIYEKTTVQIDVSSPSGVENVRLYVDTNSDSTLLTRTMPYIITWNVNDANDSTTHQLYAEAQLGNGQVIRSNVIQVVSYKFTPRNLYLDSFGETSLLLSWQGNTKQGMKYLIEQAIVDSVFILRDSTTNILSKVLSGVYQTNKVYHFRVRAQKDTMWSKYSNVAQGTIPFVAPILQRVFSNNDSTITLQLQDNSSIEQSFQIEDSTDGSTFHVIKNISANTSSTDIVSNYNVGVRYYFRVCAKSVYNTSPYSNILDTTAIFIQPSDISLTSQSSSQFQIDWKNQSRFTKSFAVERQIGVQGFSRIATIDFPTTSYKETQPDVKQQYQYRIQALCDNYASAYSSIITARYGGSAGKNYLRQLVGHTTDVRSLAFGAHDSILVSGSEDNTVRFWNALDGSFIRSIYTGPATFAYGPHVSTSNQYVAVVMSDTSINIYNINSASLQKHLSLPYRDIIYSTKFSPDGQYFAAIDRALNLWRVSDWTLLYANDQYMPEYDISFSPDSKYIATGSYEGIAYIYELATGNMTKSAVAYDYQPLWTVCFSPDGQELAMGTTVSAFYIWHVNGSETPSTVGSLGGAVWSLIYTLGGDLITACDDHVLRVWRNESLVDSFSPAAHTYKCLALTQDNQKLAAGQAWGNIDMWSLPLKWVGY